MLGRIEVLMAIPLPGRIASYMEKIMAQERAHPSNEAATDTAGDAGRGAEWNALRDDLDDILKEAESALDADAAREAEREKSTHETHVFLDHINSLRSQLKQQNEKSVPSPDRRREGPQPVQRSEEPGGSKMPEAGRNPVGESLQAAIEKIRAGQKLSAPPKREQAANDSGKSGPGLNDIVEMTARLADRIGNFERSVGERFDKILDTAAVARQIGLLTETVGQMSQLVKKAGDTSKLESKLAEFLTLERADPAVDMLSGRMERLNESVRKLADIQVRQVRRGERGVPAGAADQQVALTQHIEASIRSLYDKLDALERSVAIAPAEMERLSHGIGTLAAALEKEGRIEAVSDELIGRVNAIASYVETLEPSEGSTGFVELKGEINTLRRYMVEAFEPRFDALETRIKDLSARMAGDPDGIGQELLEEQLRLLVAKVDQAGAMLSGLSKRQAELAERQPPDLARLVDLIAAKTAAEVNAHRPADTIGVSNIAVAAMRESIAQVDRRLDNLQDTLKRLHRAQQGATPQSPGKPAEASARMAPAESGATRSALPFDEPPSPPPAYLPPPRGELPAKPTSTLGQSADDVFKRAAEKAATRASEAQIKSGREEQRENSPVSRESFIEAARRAAQRSTEASVLDANGGFLGKALARLKRKSPEEPGDNEEPEAPVPPKEAAPAETKSADEVVIEEPDVHASAEEERESFLSRHRRPILLAASFVAVGLMMLNLIGQRLNSSQGESIEMASAEPATLAVAAEIEVPTGLEPGEEAAPSEVRKVGAVADAITPDSTLVGGAIEKPATLDMDLAFADAAPDSVVTGSIDETTPVIGVGPLALREAAEAGDARAQFEIAAIYTEGRAAPQDYGAAALWYERSATSGFAPAQYRLGNLYENGRGVALDLELARQWYQAAAEAGNRMAMHNLAALYAGGLLTTQDFASAAMWFEKAAGLGVKDSQFNFGMLYARGLGVRQDFVRSYMWFDLAALGGDTDAATARDDIARSLDADALRLAQGLVEAWRIGTIDIAANYAPIGTWAANFDPGQSITDPQIVMQVQQVLAQLGYEVGEADGVIGPRTGIAIRAFEAAAGMSETGMINPRLLAVLGSQPV